MSEPRVFIVDNDDALREALCLVMEMVGLPTASHGSAREFLAAYQPGTPGVLVLDLRMPEMSGLELMAELRDLDIELPTIILTGHGDIHTAVRAVKFGAYDVIEKPFSHQYLIETVQRLFAEPVVTKLVVAKSNGDNEMLSRLTPRERDVLKRVVVGKTNKVIAYELGISIKTVEHHRHNIMAKTGARTLADLIEKVSGIRDAGDGN